MCFSIWLQVLDLKSLCRIWHRENDLKSGLFDTLGSFVFIINKLLVNERSVTVKPWMEHSARSWFRWSGTEIIFINVLTNCTLAAGHNLCYFGKFFALFIKQLSDTMGLIHCKHSPFHLVFIAIGPTKIRVMVKRTACDEFSEEEYRPSNPNGYSYSCFCAKYAAWKKACGKKVVLPQEREPRKELFIDWIGTLG